jgi:hypothetical protein
MQTLIYSYAKDSYLHERSVAALLTPYVICKIFFLEFLNKFFFFSCIADGIILSEMFRIRQQYIKKETIRISIGTWNINGDKNPALDDEYPSILDAWILDGPENLSAKNRKTNSIETKGIDSDY